MGWPEDEKTSERQGLHSSCFRGAPFPVDLQKTEPFSVWQRASLRSLKTDCSTAVAKPVLRQPAFRGVVLILMNCQ